MSNHTRVPQAARRKPPRQKPRQQQERPQQQAARYDHYYDEDFMNATDWNEYENDLSAPPPTRPPHYQHYYPPSPQPYYDAYNPGPPMAIYRPPPPQQQQAPPPAPVAAPAATTVPNLKWERRCGRKYLPTPCCIPCRFIWYFLVDAGRIIWRFLTSWLAIIAYFLFGGVLLGLLYLQTYQPDELAASVSHMSKATMIRAGFGITAALFVIAACIFITFSICWCFCGDICKGIGRKFKGCCGGFFGFLADECRWCRGEDPEAAVDAPQPPAQQPQPHFVPGWAYYSAPPPPAPPRPTAAAAPPPMKYLPGQR